MADPVKTLITPKATLSYPHLATAQPGQKPTDKAKFSATLVFAPGVDISELQAAAMAVAEAKFPGKAVKMFQDGALKSPFRRDAESKGYADGSIFINTRSEKRPGVVYGDLSNVPLEKIEEDLYPGAQVRASVRPFYYDSNGNKGVSFALNNVQKVGDGTRLDNRKAASEEFSAVALNETPADLSSIM